MRVLSSDELLEVWERGREQPPAQRALILLATAWPEMSVEELTGLSVGRRDALLLTLREQTFGSKLVCVAHCEGCGERLELSFSADEIRLPLPCGEPTEVLSLSRSDYDIQFRLPNSQDLIALAGEEEVTVARRKLVERCILSARLGGTERSVEQLPESVVTGVVEAMAQADPQANVQLALSCPNCHQQWQAAFDITEFFWSELHAWALRLMREVHTLALSYGWRERDIVALSPWRRRAYLEMVTR